MRRRPSTSLVSGSWASTHHERVDEEDETDRALAHIRLVLGEDRERLELRVAGSDEDDVQPEQSEEDAVANDRRVAELVI